MKNPNQPSLFQDLADAEQQRGFKTKDERAFEKERTQRSKAKSKQTPMPKAPATGPACLRCLRWRKPLPGNDLGACSLLVRVETRYPQLNLDAGTVISLDQAERLHIADIEYLRTGEAFTCTAFADEAEVAA